MGAASEGGQSRIILVYLVELAGLAARALPRRLAGAAHESRMMASPRRFLPVLLAVVAAVAAAHLRAASHDPVRARHGMVGSTDEHASRAGLQILQKGGNAVDASVAVGFALAVTHPAAGNLGGGGFMVIRMADGRETTIDYREAAPAAAQRDMFLDRNGEPVPNRSQVGPLASGVPGSVAGLVLAQRRYGRLPLADVMAPAIALARDGFEVSWALADSLHGAQDLLANFSASARAFRRADGTMPAAGDRLVQADLANTLALIASQGADAFYKGAIADSIAAEMTRSGGLITKADLSAYAPRERPPIVGMYRGHRVISMPPPSSGGIALVQLLNILENFPLADYGHNSSRSIHLVAEAARRVYADRSEWLGDPDFFNVPVSGLLSRRYADTLRAGISKTRATSSRDVKPGQPRNFEPSDTTHYSVVDAEGNAVATTTTLNGSYRQRPNGDRRRVPAEQRDG